MGLFTRFQVSVRAGAEPAILAARGAPAWTRWRGCGTISARFVARMVDASGNADGVVGWTAGGAADVADARRQRIRAARGRRSCRRAGHLPGRGHRPQPERRRAQQRLRARAGAGAGPDFRRPQRGRASRGRPGTAQRPGLRRQLRLPPGRGHLAHDRRADLRHHADRALRPGQGRQHDRRAGRAGLAAAATQAGAVAGDRRRPRRATGRPAPGRRGACGARPRRAARIQAGPAVGIGRRTGGGRRDLAWRHRRRSRGCRRATARRCS